MHITECLVRDGLGWSEQLTNQTKPVFKEIYGMHITKCLVRDDLGWSEQLTNQTKPGFRRSMGCTSLSAW